MGSFSAWHAVIVVAIFLVLVLAAKASSGLTGALVVKKFFVSNSPREDGVYIEIVGRQSGLIAWLFALMRIDPTLEMRVRYTKVEYVVSNFTGFTRIILPIESVSSVFFGVHRPWKKALGWLLFFIALAYGAAEFGSTSGTLGLLVLGLIGITYWQSMQSSDIAEIDASLLSGELPISAYLDSGFEAWLKRSSQ